MREPGPRAETGIMEAILKIYDETPGGPRAAPTELRLASERITAADLIRRRVTEEVEAYNAKRGEVFQGLVQPTESEQVLNGFKPRSQRKLDVEKQVEAALAGFRGNGFLLLFDDRQVDDPDEWLTVTPDSSAVFVRLVPLVGG